MSDDLIIEDFDFESNKVQLVEDIQDGKRIMKFKGIFSEADTPNRNHRVYPKSVLREAFNNLQSSIKTNGSPLVGELEHAQDAKIHLERIAVTFPVLEWNEEKGQIIGEAVPADTPMGNIVSGLAKSGIRICFSTRCAGKVKPYSGPLSESDSNLVEVCPGLRIISLDVVGSPSCQKAVSSTVYESTLTEGEETKKPFKEAFDSMF
jgi:hypothetical protein